MKTIPLTTANEYGVFEDATSFSVYDKNGLKIEINVAFDGKYHVGGYHMHTKTQGRVYPCCYGSIFCGLREYLTGPEMIAEIVQMIIEHLEHDTPGIVRKNSGGLAAALKDFQEQFLKDYFEIVECKSFDAWADQYLPPIEPDTADMPLFQLS